MTDAASPGAEQPTPPPGTGSGHTPGGQAGSAAPDSPAAAPRRRRRRIPAGVDVLIALIAIALVQAFIVKPFRVPSQSMEETLGIGDRIVVNRLDNTVDRGEIVVFGHGATWSQSRLPADPSLFKEVVRTVGDWIGIGPSHTQYTVKRVIGMPGDTVACCTSQGKVTVNGQALDEPYIYEDLRFEPGTFDCSSAQPSARCFAPITVPEGNLLVMGDHRSQSADSVISCRGSTKTDTGCARFVPEERVVGPVVWRLWPLGRLGGV